MRQTADRRVFNSTECILVLTVFSFVKICEEENKHLNALLDHHSLSVAQVRSNI